MTRFLALLLFYSLPCLANAADSEMEKWYREFIAHVASENYKAVVDHIHPSGFTVGDLYVQKDEIAKELNNPLSDRRKQLIKPFAEHEMKMCHDYGTAFVHPKTFISMTHGKYGVYMQTDLKPHFLVSAYADVKLDTDAVCTLRLFPIDIEKMNGRLYSMGIP